MATPTPLQTQIAREALAVYGVKLSEATLSFAVAQVGSNGGLPALMNILYERDLGALTPAAAAARIVDNIGMTGGARSIAVDYVAAQLATVPVAQRGALVVAMIDTLAAATLDPVWGIWANKFNADVSTALQTPAATDVYIRAAAEAAKYAPWVVVAPPVDPGGGGTTNPPTDPGTGGGTTNPPTDPGGGTTNPPPGPRILDVKALSDSIASKIGDNPIPSEGFDIVLSATPTTTYSIDADGSAFIEPREITTVTPVLGVDYVTGGKANERLTLTQVQLRTNAIIDLGGQPDNVIPGLLREGADVVTLDHSDMDKNGLVEAADAPLRPTLTLKPGGVGLMIVGAAGGGALQDQKAQYDFRGVEILDLTKAATSDRFNDAFDASTANGITVNLGPALTVGASNGGGAVTPLNVAQLDANTLDTGGIAPVGAGLGLEWMTVGGVTLIERWKGSPGDDRLVVAADTAMQSVGSGSYAWTTGPVRTRFDQSTAFAGGVTDTPSKWEDQSLYTFDLAGGANDALDYYAETAAAVTVSVGTSAGGSDRVFIGAPAAGGGRIDLATSVERFYGGHGGGAAQNWIDLAAATVATTVDFGRLAGSLEIPEPNGYPALSGLTRGTEVKASADGTLFAVFVDRTGLGLMAASAWNNLQGSALAETVILRDSLDAHQLQLAGGANKLDYSQRSQGITLQIGAVDLGTAALAQLSVVGSDNIQQFLGTDRSSDRLTVVATQTISDVIDISAFQAGIVTRNDPALPTLSQIDPQYHLVDLEAGIAVESFNGQYEPTGSTGPVAARAFTTGVSGFEAVVNTGDADAVQLLGNGIANRLVGGSNADVLRGGRGIAGDGTSDVGAGNHGDRLFGGLGADSFVYRDETESPGGSVTGGQQNGTLFSNKDINVTNARDTLADFISGTDRIVISIGDSWDSVRVLGSVPPLLSLPLNSGVPLLSNFTPASATLDIGKDAASTGTVDDFDNYAFDTPGTTLTIGDIVLRVAASSGGDLIDASAGLSLTALGSPSTDGLRVNIVYGAATDSQGPGYDQIVHFTSASDKIDLSFLKIPRLEISKAGNGVDYDRNHNNIVDALETGLVRNIGAAPPFSINSSVPNLFIDQGTYRPVTIQPLGTGGGTTTVVFVDADGDGNYVPEKDMVFVLVGIGNFVSSDIIVDAYGGAWGG